jgi:hypothetical protein
VQRKKSEEKDPGSDVSAFFLGEDVRTKLRNIHTSTQGWYGGPGMGVILLSLPLLSFIIVNCMPEVLETEFLVDKTTFKTRLFFMRTEFFTLTVSGPARCAINIHRAMHDVEISW